MKLIFIKVKYFFKVIRKFFFCIFWYEIVSNKQIRKKNYNLIVIKSKNQFHKLNKKKIIKIKKSKLSRFKRKIYLLALMKNRKMLSSGWIFFGKKWKVTEIDVSVALNKTYLLFDFETPENLRNKGYYTLLLKLIKNKFRKKRLAIYTLSYNFKSRRGIENAGFKFVRKIYS